MMRRTLSCAALASIGALACHRSPDHCESEGAVKTQGLCDCPPGTKLDKPSDTCIPEQSEPVSDGSTTGLYANETDGSMPSSDGPAGMHDFDAASEMAPTSAAPADSGSPQPTTDPVMHDAGDVSDHVAEAGTSSAPDDGSLVDGGESGMEITCAPSAEICDGKDNNCNGQVDEGVKNACGGCAALANAPGSSCSAGADTCARTGMYRCDGIDSVTCDATPLPLQTWYPDCDGDGYAALNGAVQGCLAPSPTESCKGYLQEMPIAGSTLDCNDDASCSHPGAKLQCLAGFNSPADYQPTDVDCSGALEIAEYVARPITLPGGAVEYQVVPVCVPNTCGPAGGCVRSRSGYVIAPGATCGEQISTDSGLWDPDCKWSAFEISTIVVLCR